MLQGEQRFLRGVCANVSTDENTGVENKTPINITGWQIESQARFYDADVSFNGSNPVVSGFSENTVEDKAIESEVADGPNGIVTIKIPKDLYEGDIAINATRIPAIVIYTTVANGARPPSGNEDNRTIISFRYLILMRAGYELSS